jgi:hypothetical protein
MKIQFDPENPDSKQIPENYIQKLRNLRDGTEESLGSEEIDGRLAVCFRVHQEEGIWTVWADPKNGLPIQVRAELNMGGQEATVVMHDFAFDKPVDESLFSLEVPPGYELMGEEPFKMDVSLPEATEEALVETLRLFSEEGAETFPPGLNLTSLFGYIKKFEEEAKKGKQAKEGKRGPALDMKHFEKTQRMTLTLLNMWKFVQSKEAEGDWHYDGEGVRFGDADTPIAWWKGNSPNTYRVLYGDLTLRDIDAESLPQTSTEAEK